MCVCARTGGAGGASEQSYKQKLEALLPGATGPEAGILKVRVACLRLALIPIFALLFLCFLSCSLLFCCSVFSMHV